MIFNFNQKNKKDGEEIIKICALLIHAAKIDENFSLKEEEIIKQTLLNLGVKSDNLSSILTKAKIIEEDSNQILDFTREVKNMENEKKIHIVEALWRIIYSDKEADIYETNLMRRLTALLYIDNKIIGDIKEKIKKENT